MAVYSQTNAPVYTIDNVYLQTIVSVHAANNKNQTEYSWRVNYTPAGEAQSTWMCAGTDVTESVNANTPVIEVRLDKAAFIANVIPFINTHSVVMSQSTEAEKNDWRS